MILAISSLTGLVAGIGAAQALVASRLVASFASRPRVNPAMRPPVTVLKPLHGDEPLLLEALTTLCRQDYPEYQIVCGVQTRTDPAVAVVQQLRQSFPGRDITLVVDPTMHGRNYKVGNLINMMTAARHDMLVIADSDIHVRPDYLDRLVTALLQPGVGLVTTLYAGLAAQPVMAARLAATQITHLFLPGAVLARRLGRNDCLGATMVLRRQDLNRIGGFQSLVNHLADDNVLGRRISALGLQVILAATVPLTTVPETTFSALFRHELRWARTIRALEPAGFAASVLQYPLFWAVLTLVLSGLALWSLAFFLAVWVLRALAAITVDNALSRDWGSDDKATLAFSCPVWLLPLRDILSVIVLLASYAGRSVDWRGQTMHADTPARSQGLPVPTPGTTKDTNTR
jgi:ceramide glucosyltransferase